MELRNYQKECIETINNLPDGSKSVVAIATGLGKTTIAAHIPFNGRMLWLSHRDELVRQPEHYFAEQGISFGIEKAESHAGDEDVISASVQSLYRDERLHQFNPDDFDIIICDEAHHAAAPTYKKILRYFTPRKLIGLTATPKRGDNVRLNDVFDSICFARDLRWGIEHGYLAHIRCVRVTASFNMNNIEKQAGDYAVSDLEKEMQDSDNDIVVAKAYLEYCVPENKQTLIYCPTIKICKLVEATIKKTLSKDQESTVCMLSQENTDEERHEIIEGYKAGRIHCIVNCMILTEGTDLPETSVIINNRPSANASLYQQIIGRGTRLADNKEYCLVIDIVGDNAAYKGLCTAPTLFGIDPDFIPESMKKELENVDLLEISEAFSEARAQTAKQAQIAFEMVDLFAKQRYDIINNAKISNTPDVSKKIADDYKNMIETEAKEYDFGDLLVKVTPDDKHHYRIKPSFQGVISLSSPDMLGNTIMDIDIPEIDVSTISSSMNMDEAIQFAYDIAKYAVPEYFALTWSRTERANRALMPATDRQKDSIATKYKAFDCKLVTDNLNRLQAGDLIDMYNEITETEKKKKVLQKEAEQYTKVRKGKVFEKWMNKKEQERLDEQRAYEMRISSWEATKQKLQTYIQNGKRRIAQKQAEMEALLSGNKMLSVPMKYDYFRPAGTPASDRQRSFVSDLERDIRRMGGDFDIVLDVDELDLDMWHTGFLINALMTIKNCGLKIKNKTLMYGLADYLKETKKITEVSSSNPKSISISVTVID